MNTLWDRDVLMTSVRHWLAVAAMAVGLCALLLAAAACSGASSPMTGSLKLEGRPALGEPFLLRLELRTSMAFTDVEASFVLPAGVELLSTPGEWRVDMELEQTYAFSATARVPENGYFRICGGGVKAFRDGSARWGYGDCIYVLVEGEDTWVSYEPPPNHWRSADITAPGGLTLQPELIQNRLYLSGTLALNQSATLIYEVTPLVDLRAGTVTIVVPIGGLRSREPHLEVSDPGLATTLKFSGNREGEFAWFGPMKSQATYSFYVTLEPTGGGEGLVMAGVDETGSVDSVSRIIIENGQRLPLMLYSPSLAR